MKDFLKTDEETVEKYYWDSEFIFQISAVLQSEQTPGLHLTLQGLPPMAADPLYILALFEVIQLR